MKKQIAKALLVAAAGAFIAAPAASSAQTTVIATIEDFEGYTDGIGAWALVDVDNIVGVQLNLGISNPLSGLRDLRSVLGIALPGGKYTIQNLDLESVIPDDAEDFTFTMKSLVQLNLGRTVQITIRTQDNIDHVSPEISLATLIVSTEPTDISVSLSDFTPPLSGGQTVTGVSLEYETSLAGVAAVEQLDSLRFEWEAGPASVDDWTLYQ